jgi:hypothetical protein
MVGVIITMTAISIATLIWIGFIKFLDKKIGK